MKTKLKPNPSLVRIGLILNLTFLLCFAVQSKAASGTWTNDFDSIWSDPTNWLDNVVADGAGSTVTFSNELASTVVVNLDSARTIGNLVFVQGTFTITNNGNDLVNILTLDGPAKPVISVPATMAATIRRTVVAGTNGFILDGGGILNVYKGGNEAIPADPANTWTGTVILSNGTLQVQGDDVNVSDFPDPALDAALDGITSFTFFNGSTLNIQPDGSTGPSYGTMDANLIVPAGQSGTLVLPPRFGGSVGDGSGAIGTGLGGSLTGSGTLTVSCRYLRGNVVGDWSAFSGQLNINPLTAGADNEFRFGNPAGFPSASIDIGGTTPLAFNYYRSLAANTTIPIGVLSSANTAATVPGSDTAAFTLLFDVGTKLTNATDTATFAGTVVNGAGPAGIIKRGAGTWVLTGNNSYTGPTTISNGVLQIGDGASDSGAIGSGPITNYSALIFAHGAGTLAVNAPITGPGAITNNGTGGTLILRGANTYTAPTVVTAGKLFVGTASKATGAYILESAAEGFGAVMLSPGATLTISSLSFNSASTFEFDFGTFSNPSTAFVTNTGNLNLNGNVTVNITGTELAVGTITLLKYNSRTGSGNFVLGTVPSHVTSATLNDDTVNKQVTLTINTTFDNTLRWVGDAAGVWDIGNPANLVWREVGSGLLTNYYDGARVRFDDTATGTTNIDIAATVSPSSIIVDNSASDYKFSGAGWVSGTTTLTKRGSGKLTLTTANDYTGQNRVEAGTLELGDGVIDGLPGTGAITNNGTLLLDEASTITLANVISGSGNVVQAGPGQVNLSGASTYTGGLTIRPGTTLGNNNGNAGGIGGGITIQSGTLQLSSDVFNNVGSITVITNGTFLNTGGNRLVDAPISGTNVIVVFNKSASLITLNRSIAGISGIITNTGAGGLRFNSGGGNNATDSADALWVLETPGGFLQPRNSSVNSLGAVTGLGTISASQSGAPTFVTWLVGALNTDSEFSGVVSDGSAFGSGTRFTALTKVGTGTWTLTNASLIYRGATIVSNGTMSLAGTTTLDTSTNVVIVTPGIMKVTDRVGGSLTLGGTTTNQTLRGNGTFTGNLVLGSNARLEPGLSIGTLVVAGNASLGGAASMEINGPGTPLFDQLSATAITYGGTLNVTNIGSLALTNGAHVFQLFNAPTIGGTFTTVNLPPLPATKTWDTSELGAGRIKLVVNVNSTPTSITTSVTGNTLQLSWPADHTGWRLQVQTNSVNVGIANNWVDVPGSDLTNAMSFPISQANGTVFYRMVFP